MTTEPNYNELANSNDPLLRDLAVIVMSEQTGSRWMMAAAESAVKEIQRLRSALAIISYMDAQNGEDAKKMRSIATDITMWGRPDSMWWYGKDYGPRVASSLPPSVRENADVGK